MEDDLTLAQARVREYLELDSDEEEDERISLEEECADPQNLGQQVMVFESAANEYFLNRTFQGLVVTASERDSGVSSDKVIRMGQEGIAAQYTPLPLPTLPLASPVVVDIEDTTL